MKKFWSRVNKVVLGGITVIVFFLLGFLWWLFDPQDTVPMWAFSLAVIIGYAACVIVYAVASRNVEVTYVLPKVKSIRHTGSKIIFLLEKNELLMQSAYVTIAYQDEDDLIEVVLGIGYVETINSQGNMQVVFIKQVGDPQAMSIVSSLSDKKHCKNAIKIKPAVQKTFIEEDLNLWETY